MLSRLLLKSAGQEKKKPKKTKQTINKLRPTCEKHRVSIRSFKLHWVQTPELSAEQLWNRARQHESQTPALFRHWQDNTTLAAVSRLLILDFGNVFYTAKSITTSRQRRVGALARPREMVILGQNVVDFKQMRIRCCNDGCELVAESHPDVFFSHLRGMWSLVLNHRLCHHSSFCGTAVNSSKFSLYH